MLNQILTLLFIISISTLSIGQEQDLLLSNFKDSTQFKAVIRTEKKIDDRYEALDNMTIKVSPEETKVYYIRYDDGMISSLTFPWSINELLVAFEQDVYSVRCTSNECVESVSFEIGENLVRIPIDVLNEEMLSTFMLKLEE